ncbi:hypothetical protein V2J09_010675 [Rumex salicifolius]
MAERLQSAISDVEMSVTISAPKVERENKAKMELMRMAISSSQRGKLISTGYTSVSSLLSVSPSQLSRDLSISEVEANEILKAASHGRMEQSDNQPVISGAQSAWDMLHEDDFSTRITTSCPDLDSILGGGISCKEVTEIGGVPGIGKTQLGIQLAINVQIPLDCGGVEGKAIYIDTEGSFMVERALQIAQGCVEDMITSSYINSRDGKAKNDVLDPKQFLSNIFYFRVCSYTEQIGLVNHLDKFISQHKDVKIVIIDSITFHFRQDFEDLALRTRVLSSMALKLMKLSQKFNLAVVVLNQVTTKYTNGSYQLTLALGDGWSHASTNRLILYWNDNERCAYIDKSPSLPSASATYSVTSNGIRNATSPSKRIKLN